MIVEVVAHLGGPVLINHGLHLDGLLAYARAQEMDIPPPPRSAPLSDFLDIHIPINVIEAREHRIYLTTSWLPADEPRYRTRWIRRRDTEDIESLDRTFVPSSGPGRNLVATGYGVTASEARWLAATDDPGEVRRLVQQVGYIGRCRGHGHGAVREWRVRDVDGTPGDTLSSGGMARRSLPVSWLRSWDGEARRIAVAPPYWHPEAQIEAVPAGTVVDLEVWP